MIIKVKVLLLQVESDLRLGTEITLHNESTINDLVVHLSALYPVFRSMVTDSKGVLLPNIRMAVGGLVKDANSATLKDGVEVAFYPIIAGG